MPEFLKVHFKFSSFLASIAIASFFVIFFLVFTASTNAATGINRQINFQGKLVTNPGGTNVSNTSYTIVFTFYNNPNVGQGTALWTETQTVTTTDGIFRVALGSVTPFPANFNFNWDGLYLGINVNSNGEMVPRIQMAAVPFAFNAQQVAGLTVQDDSGNASTSGTLQIGNTKTVRFSGTNALYFNDSGGSTTITFPTTGALTLVGQDNSQTITNKIIGTGGLTFNVANNNTDIATSSNQNFTIVPNGSGLLGLNVNSNLLSSLDLRANNLVGGTISVASISGTTSFAAMVVDQSGLGDIFTASAAGGTRFVIQRNGNVGILTGASTSATLDVAGTASIGGQLTFRSTFGQIQTTVDQQLTLGGSTTGRILLSAFNGQTVSVGQTGSIAFGGYNNCTLKTDGSGNLQCQTDLTGGGGGYSPFQEITGVNGGVIAPNNSTMDFLIGGQSSASANFRVTGKSAPFAGTAVGASVSAKTSFAAFVVDNQGVGDLFTASAAGGTRFTITRAGDISSTGNLTLAGTTGINLTGNGANLNFTGTGISTITTVANQSLAINPAGFGLVGINTDGVVPLANFDVRANIGTLAVASVSGTTSFASLVVDQSGLGDIFTASAAGLPLFTIQRNGNIVDTLAKTVNFSGAALTVSSCAGCGGVNYWGLNSGNGVTNGGFLYAGNTTADLIIGGTSTASAKFAVLNMNSGTPTATVAGNFIIMPYTNGASELGGLVGIGTINPLATLSVAGTGLFQTPIASTAAFQVQNANGAPVFLVDTTNSTNLLTNPGFEIGITGWSLRNGSTISKNSNKKFVYHGQASLLAATSTSANSGASTNSFTGTLGAGTYTLSFDAMLGTQTLTTLNAGYNQGASDVNCVLNNNTVKTTGFQRYSCTFTTSGNISYIYIDQGTGTTALNLYIDAVQLQVGGLSTAYTIGSIQLRGLINSPVGIQTLTDSTTALQIQNAAGTNTLFVADTLDNAIGIGTNTPLATLDVRGLNGTTPIASVSGTTSFASLVVDNSLGDLITASASGATRFVVRQNGSVGIGNGSNINSGYTLDVLGSARIGSSNTSGNDIFKSTTSDFTQTGSSITTVESNNIPTVSTSSNQLGLVTDLIGAGANLTAPANGTGIGFNVGAGAIAFQRPDSKFILVAAGGTSVTRLYDYTNNTFSSGPALPFNVGAGTNAFQRPDGKFMILEGGTNLSAIYTATGSATQMGMINLGPNLSGVVAAGSQVLRKSDGTYLVILGGGTNATSIYNPTLAPVSNAPLNSTDSGSFTTGPILTGNVTTGSFAFETIYGKWIVGLGGTQTTNMYDPSTNSFSAGPSWSAQTATNTGAGAHVIQRPDYKYEIILGGGNTATVVYDPVSNTYALGPALSAGANTGAHSFQRSNGTWVTVLGGGSAVTTNIYDPTANSGAGTFTDAGSTTYLFAGNNAGAGAHSFQRPDGKYIIVSGNGAPNYTIYDAGWNTTGTWTSEQITNAYISSYSAMLWTGDPQSANNNARLDKSTTDINVKTAANTTGLASANWMSIANSGNLIGGVVSPPGAIQFQVTFNAPVRSYPQLVTSNINQSNIWGGESFTFNRRSFLSPTIYTLTVSNPLVQYGGLISDPSYGRNFATAGALLEGVVTDNNNQLTLATNRNLPTATQSAGIILASSSANLGGSAGAGANTIQMPNGQFLVMLGGGATATRIYDPDSNTFIPGPTGGACNSGCHSFQLPNGKFFVVLGGASAATKIYDPASNVFYNGPNLTQTATTGSTTFQRPDGLFVILIGGSNQANTYDPFLNQITAGPAISGATTIGAGTSVLRRPDGRTYINVGGQTTTYSYDAAVNSFVMNGTGETHANALAAGAVAYQGPTGRWFIPRGGGGGNNTSSVIDPILNTIVAGPVMPAGAIANTGALWIPRPDGKAILATGNGTTTSAVYDPEVNGGTGQLWTGPNLPCGVGAGATIFQRQDGSFVLICGGSTANTAIIDSGWNIGGSYTTEQIYEPLLSANSSLFWENANNQGNIYVKYRTAASQAVLGVTSWKDARVSGNQIAYNLNDSWIQVRFDFQGSIPDAPGAKSRVWASSDTSGPVTYYRTVSAPVLSYWKLMNSTTPTILTLTSNGSNAFRFSADGQAFTAAGGAWNSGGADLAENYTSTQSLEPGDVVVGDRYNSQNVIRSTDSYQSNIMGVVSTKPGFVAGAYTPNSYPIALVGRVPVKISSENGPIHSGDYLTSASIPGYAMKATVAGRVLGTALEDFDPLNSVQCPADGAGSFSTTQCGTITAFINLTNYNGESVELAMADQGFTGSSSAGLSDLQMNTGLNSYMNTIAAGDGKILSYLESLRDGNSAVFGSSEVFTGKVVAGEVISPNIIADLITAKTIRADHIEGLEILTNQISSLSNSVAVLGTQSANLTTASGQIPSMLNLSSLNVDGLATVSGDLTVKGNGLFQGALNVLESITTKNLTVSDFAYFINDVVFNGNVRFNQVPTFSKDTAGFAVIKQGDDTVQITFDQEYNNTPVVTASIVLDKVGDSITQKQLENGILNGNITYVITQRTTKGFVIRLNKPASQELNFSWVALSVKDANTSGLTPLPSITPDSSATPSAGVQSILNQLNGSAGNGGVQ